jgi:hypothetical protein
LKDIEKADNPLRFRAQSPHKGVPGTGYKADRDLLDHNAFKEVAAGREEYSILQLEKDSLF